MYLVKVALSLNYTKVKITELCSTLWDPIDCSLAGSSVHGILQARILEWVAIPFIQGIIPTQGLNQGLLHCRWILYQLSYQESLVMCIMEYYSALKRKEILTYDTTWMNLENIVLNEKGQAQKDKYCISLLI